MKSAGNILVAEIGEVLWVRVECRGDLAISPPIKALGEEAIGRGIIQFVFDLEECPMMDSTFMGTLTGIALKLDEVEGASVEVFNAGSRNVELFTQLGLNHILEIDESGSARSSERETAASLLKSMGIKDASKTGVAEASLEAHQALGDADASNKDRFRDVIEFLQRDLGDGE